MLRFRLQPGYFMQIRIHDLLPAPTQTAVWGPPALAPPLGVTWLETERGKGKQSPCLRPRPRVCGADGQLGPSSLDTACSRPPMIHSRSEPGS